MRFCYNQHELMMRQHPFKDNSLKGVITHLECEIQEVKADPTDLEEYADIMLLVFSAFVKMGLSYNVLEKVVWDKIKKNERRKWEATKDPDQPVFHKKD